jgi:hypothetical protein
LRRQRDLDAFVSLTFLLKQARILKQVQVWHSAPIVAIQRPHGVATVAAVQESAIDTAPVEDVRLVQGPV